VIYHTFLLPYLALKTESNDKNCDSKICYQITFNNIDLRSSIKKTITSLAYYTTALPTLPLDNCPPLRQVTRRSYLFIFLGQGYLNI